MDDNDRLFIKLVIASLIFVCFSAAMLARV